MCFPVFCKCINLIKVVRGSRREGLTFPLILQVLFFVQKMMVFTFAFKVLDSTEGRCDTRNGRYVWVLYYPNLSCNLNRYNLISNIYRTCLRWGPQPPRGSSAPVTRKIITVSDGFYSKVKCFSCEDGMSTGQLAHGI